MSYDVKALEFDKILNEISGFTHWSKTKEYILNLMPIINLDELNIMQNEEREAYNAIIKYDDLLTTYKNDILLDRILVLISLLNNAVLLDLPYIRLSNIPLYNVYKMNPNNPGTIT